MRILVIEDEAALREGLRTDLTAAGHTVDVAADGEEGLYAALEFPIDVAIIDIGLPKLSGLEVIRRLLAGERVTFDGRYCRVDDAVLLPAPTRRLTLMDILQRFEDIAPRPPGASSTPVERALGTVLAEIDENARATFGSITIATMLRLIERQAAAATAAGAPVPPRVRAG